MNHDLWESARRAAIEAARNAWGQIAGLYETGSHVEEKAEGPTTEADKLADKVIGEFLRERFPEERYGYLTEETEDGDDRFDRERVWIIDPIDGTKDFIKKNGNFAIHIGLVERGPGGVWLPVAAAVYRPIPGEMYSAVRGAGARLDAHPDNRPSGASRPMTVSDRAPLSSMKAVISHSHRSTRLNQLMEALAPAEVFSVGSIGIKLGLIARGDYDVYVNLGRGKCREWDVCAPELILTEAGGRVTGLDGSTFVYNKPDPHDAQGVFATNGRGHDEILARVAEFERANPA